MLTKTMKIYTNLLILLLDFVLIFSSADLEISTQLSNTTDSFLPENRCQIGGGSDPLSDNFGGDIFDTLYDSDRNGIVDAIVFVSKEQGNQMPCYIQIEHYNVLRQDYDFDDNVRLTNSLMSSNSTSELSEMRRWRAFPDGQDEYKIEWNSSSGRILSL